MRPLRRRRSHPARPLHAPPRCRRSAPCRLSVPAGLRLPWPSAHVKLRLRLQRRPDNPSPHGCRSTSDTGRCASLVWGYPLAFSFLRSGRAAGCLNRLPGRWRAWPEKKPYQQNGCEARAGHRHHYTPHRAGRILQIPGCVPFPPPCVFLRLAFLQPAWLRILPWQPQPGHVPVPATDLPEQSPGSSPEGNHSVLLNRERRRVSREMSRVLHLIQ